MFNIDPVSVAICMIVRDIRNWVRKRRNRRPLPDWMYDHIS